MSEPILTHAHNIYEQQTHNRRMTWLLIVAFILLIAVVGVGFDVFLNVGPVFRLILLPFIILMVASGIWNFRQQAAAGLWKEPKAFAEDDDNTLIWWELRIAVTSTFLIIILLIFFWFKL